jgi:hypothetical protein
MELCPTGTDYDDKNQQEPDMQCSCGGSTIDRKVIRDKKTAGEYMYCQSCGRVTWLFQTNQLKKELNNG